MFSKTLNITIKLIDLLCSKSLYHFKTKEVFKKDILMTYKILWKNILIVLIGFIIISHMISVITDASIISNIENFS